jgi:gamma-glutamyltranspeptidase/glutathione hydrolase
MATGNDSSASRRWLDAGADLDIGHWDSAALLRLIHSQQACLDFRQRHLDLAEKVGAEAARLVDAARSGRLLSRWTSASTVHTSVVDDSSNGCAITASSGYGSGEMPAGTGIWLNNCLGEIELNRRGLGAGPPGARLPSNMAPSVARRGNDVLAVGSPGADRITTAMQQFLINFLQMGMSLADAVAHPRVHVDTSGKVVNLKAEAGLDLPKVDLPLMVFPEIVMYFGGVGAAVYGKKNGFGVAADPRREGGVFNPDA